MTREEIREEICNSMTVQDAIQVLKETNCYGTMDIAKSVILKALEQQLSEDCISREELDKALYEHFHEEDSPNNITEVCLGAVRNFVKSFPPANPQESKTDILDKIKAEIEEGAKIVQNVNIEKAKALCWCLDVIDKYTAESEDNNE